LLCNFLVIVSYLRAAFKTSRLLLMFVSFRVCRYPASCNSLSYFFTYFYFRLLSTVKPSRVKSTRKNKKPHQSAPTDTLRCQSQACGETAISNEKFRSLNYLIVVTIWQMSPSTETFAIVPRLPKSVLVCYPCVSRNAVPNVVETNL
jgi:hypothetical protein